MHNLNSFGKIIILTLGIVALFAAMAGAGERLTVKGSDTMVILGQRWAEAFMASHPETVVQVTGGGSGVGFAALINGTTDICEASRPIKPKEQQSLKSRFNTTGVEIPVARDGLTVYLNEANPVSELTIKQLAAVYSGEITNWKELGGEDARIIVYGRENSSGTYVYFKDEVLKGEDFAPQVQTLPGTAAIVNAVAKDKNGIGYGGAAYAKGVKYCALKADAQSPAFKPDLEHVKSGAYPLSRYLFWYLRNKPSGDMKTFVDFVLSAEGQKIVSEVGYFPVQ
ncbi:MAG: phosphate ABC transporter substrate-binding protein [candidate division Zixibacteria bacterium]|nr:phosphate ABC transporter substrate-binding protein [candidate division Zixibacteria bacterium]